MSTQYITSEEHLPEETNGETTLQITDAHTKRIFEARVRIAREPEELTNPNPLTVVAGPHESISKEWYVELLDEVDGTEVDEDLLRRLAAEQETTSNVVNTRSDDLKVLLRYLVESGQHESLSAAVRELVFERLVDEQPALVEAYDDVRTEFEADPLRRALVERR